MLLSILGTLFTSIISGGATGILGVAIQRFFDLKNKTLDIRQESIRLDHELKLKRVDLEIMDKEVAGRVRIAETEAEASKDVAESSAFAASFNEPIRYSSESTITKNQGWVFIILDFIRGVVRPGLTVYLCVLSTLVYFQAASLLHEEGVRMDIIQAMDLIKMVVGTILYLTTTCVLWWFGTRNRQKAPKIRV